MQNFENTGSVQKCALNPGSKVLNCQPLVRCWSNARSPTSPAYATLTFTTDCFVYPINRLLADGVVTGQQGPRHLIPLLVYPRVRVNHNSSGHSGRARKTSVVFRALPESPKKLRVGPVFASHSFLWISRLITVRYLCFFMQCSLYY